MPLYQNYIAAMIVREKASEFLVGGKSKKEGRGLCISSTSLFLPPNYIDPPTSRLPRNISEATPSRSWNSTMAPLLLEVVKS